MKEFVSLLSKGMVFVLNETFVRAKKRVVSSRGSNPTPKRNILFDERAWTSALPGYRILCGNLWEALFSHNFQRNETNCDLISSSVIRKMEQGNLPKKKMGKVFNACPFSLHCCASDLSPIEMTESVGMVTSQLLLSNSNLLVNFTL